MRGIPIAQSVVVCVLLCFVVFFFWFFASSQRNIYLYVNLKKRVKLRNPFSMLLYRNFKALTGGDCKMLLAHHTELTIAHENFHIFSLSLTFSLHSFNINEFQQNLLFAYVYLFHAYGREKITHSVRTHIIIKWNRRRRTGT